MPRRRCLDCRSFTTNPSRCDHCTKARKKVRNDDIKIARQVIADSPRCAWPGCGATEDLTADHVLALANGGTNHGLRQVLCRSHNSSKGAH